MEEVRDSCEQDFIRVDKFTNDAEQSAVKLLASRLVSPSPAINITCSMQQQFIMLHRQPN